MSAFSANSSFSFYPYTRWKNMFNGLFGKTLSMQGSILGFPDLNTFVLTPVDEADSKSPFAYLQSTQEEGVGFLVTLPFTFVTDYEVEVPEQEKMTLGVSGPQDVAVLGIVTIASSFEQSTVNLLAPILINVRAMTGRQIVLPPDSLYSTKTLLFPFSEEGGKL
jgi:flagellar assembly factor FliW